MMPPCRNGLCCLRIPGAGRIHARSAALAPIVHWLTGHRVPRAVAALLAVLSLLVVVGGLIAAVAFVRERRTAANVVFA
ncbi:MAG: hypothetical protein ACT4NY_00445 [Pseudonocardiales bacterium]